MAKIETPKDRGDTSEARLANMEREAAEILASEGLPQQDPAKKTNGKHPPALVEVDWRTFGYQLNANAMPLMNLANATIALKQDKSLNGHIWRDDFLDSVYTDWHGEMRQWSDTDDIALCTYMQVCLGLRQIGIGDVQMAAKMAAKENRKNECMEWLESLEWDKTPRLEHMLSEGFGAQHEPYTQAVGRCWMVSIAARVLQPGCKVDTVPVLEGGQGIGKSSALKIIGGKWFSECHENVMSKDFFGVLTGRMLVEIAEMHSFKKAEIERIKGIISCQVDRYRKVYGKHTIDYPRHTVLVCTTNRDDWQRDETGARRFWPVRCGDIALDWLKQNRDQLFAEAVYRYKAGESWWDVSSDDQKAEAEKRRDVDSWEDAITNFCASRDYVTLNQVLNDCLQIEFLRQDFLTQRRVSRILRVTGWETGMVRLPNEKPFRAWCRAKK